MRSRQGSNQRQHARTTVLTTGMSNENGDGEVTKDAGLQVGDRRELQERLDTGGDVYNNLVITRRLVPTKAEPTYTACR